MGQEMLDALFESWQTKNEAYFNNIVKEFKDTEGGIFNCPGTWQIYYNKKWPEKLRRYAPAKGNQEKTHKIIDIMDIMDR